MLDFPDAGPKAGHGGAYDCHCPKCGRFVPSMFFSCDWCHFDFKAPDGAAMIAREYLDRLEARPSEAVGGRP